MKHDAVIELQSMELIDVMGVPVLPRFLNCGTNQRMCVDTGAMQSIVSHEIGDGLDRCGSVDEFMPTGEPFVADLVELDVVIGEERYKIEVAVALEFTTMLQAMQIDGIVGLDVLQHASCTFSYAQNLTAPAVRFEKRHQVFTFTAH
jgi:hypothetical protein